MNKSIVIYGGSFDPVHLGHEAIINSLAKSNLGDEIWVIPCATRSDKTFLLDGQERYELLRKIVKDQPNVRVLRTEIDNKAMIPTYELIQLFKKQYPNYDFWFVIGADLVPTLKDWKHPNELKQQVQFIVTNRGGYTKNKEEFPKKYRQIAVEEIKMSSSEIRKLVKEERPQQEKIKLLEHMVSREVIQVLINKNVL